MLKNKIEKNHINLLNLRLESRGKDKLIEIKYKQIMKFNF
jgi:hypothetical protein